MAFRYLELPFEVDAQILVADNEVKEIKILVVDDEAGLIAIVSHLLEEAHYKVVGVTDAFQAQNKISEEYFDLIISDIMMPEMTGIEFLHWIKERTESTPVLLISGYLSSADQLAKADAFLAKPFSAYDLILVVERLLDN